MLRTQFMLERKNLHLLEFEKVSKSVRDELARMMGMVIMMAMV